MKGEGRCGFCSALVWSTIVEKWLQCNPRRRGRRKGRKERSTLSGNGLKPPVGDIGIRFHKNRRGHVRSPEERTGLSYPYILFVSLRAYFWHGNLIYPFCKLPVGTGVTVKANVIPCPSHRRWHVPHVVHVVCRDGSIASNMPNSGKL